MREIQSAYELSSDHFEQLVMVDLDEGFTESLTFTQAMLRQLGYVLLDKQDYSDFVESFHQRRSREDLKHVTRARTLRLVHSC